MMRWLGLSILLIVLAGCRQAVGGATLTPPASPTDAQATAESTLPAGKLTIEVVPELEPVVVGEAALLVNVRDAAGQPVEGARIEARADMTHAGMTPAFAASVDETAPGVYRVVIDWSMGGDWVVELTVTTADGASATQQVDLRVES